MTTTTEHTQDVEDEATVDDLADETIGQKIRRYADLRAVQRAKQAESDAAKLAANALQAELVEAMGDPDADMQAVKLRDGRTVYLHHDIRAGKNPDVSPDTFHDALRAAGLADLIKASVHSKTLESYARELDKNDEELPEQLAAVMTVHRIPSVRVRNS